MSVNSPVFTSTSGGESKSRRIHGNNRRTSRSRAWTRQRCEGPHCKCHSNSRPDGQCSSYSISSRQESRPSHAFQATSIASSRFCGTRRLTQETSHLPAETRFSLMEQQCGQDRCCQSPKVQRATQKKRQRTNLTVVTKDYVQNSVRKEERRKNSKRILRLEASNHGPRCYVVPS